MSGLTIRATTVGAGALGVAASRQLPFTGIALGVFAVLAVGLIVTGLVVRALSARGE
jgi:hypothetical protein